MSTLAEHLLTLQHKGFERFVATADPKAIEVFRKCKRAIKRARQNDMYEVQVVIPREPVASRKWWVQAVLIPVKCAIHNAADLGDIEVVWRVMGLGKYGFDIRFKR